MSAVKVKTILGSMDIAKRATMNEGKLMLNLFAKYGYKEVDTAYMYGEGKTEVYLGNMKDSVDPKFLYATKANPWEGKGLGPASVRQQLETSLLHLKRDSVDIFYLHAPDHQTSLSETLGAVKSLHEEGKFLELGLSNFSSWLVAEVVNVCKQEGCVTPTVYQGMYSALTRMVEKELLPCLRYHGIRFYGFSPLGGGLLTGKHRMGDETKNEPGRFFGATNWNALYRDRYWKPEYFKAVTDIARCLNSTYGEGEVSVAEAAYQWLYHHSALKGELGDGVVVGASTVRQLDQNLKFTTKGPLHNDVVKTIEGVWRSTSNLCPEYAR